MSETSRRGFTFVELAGVTVVLAAISFAAIPAMSGIDRAAEAADRAAVETLAVVARQRARATGRPHALRLSADGRGASVVWIPEVDSDPVVAPSPTGAAGEPRRLDADPVSGIDGLDGARDLWFHPDGRPFASPPEEPGTVAASETITVRFTRGGSLSVAPRTGTVTR